MAGVTAPASSLARFGNVPGNNPGERRPTLVSDARAFASAAWRWSARVSGRRPLRSKRSRVRVAPGPLWKVFPACTSVFAGALFRAVSQEWCGKISADQGCSHARVYPLRAREVPGGGYWTCYERPLSSGSIRQFRVTHRGVLWANQEVDRPARLSPGNQ
jgi:hypothetical protein